MNWWSGSRTQLGLYLLTAALSSAAACSGRTTLPNFDRNDGATGGSTGTANGGSNAGGSSAGGSSAGGRGGTSPSGGRSGTGGTRGGTAGEGGASDGGDGGDAGQGGSPDDCRTLSEVFAVDRASLEALRDVCAITHVLHLRGNLDDLLPLSNLVRLNAVGIANTNLTSLHGLENVRTLEGLVIQGNPLLSDLSALGNVTQARSVDINDNAKLEHVDGLAGLRRLTELTVMGNPALVSLTGFRNAVGTSYDVRVSVVDNDALTNVDGLDGLRPDGALYVTDNGVLADIRGLRVATKMNSVGIWGNASLSSLDGLEDLVDPAYFYLYDNPALQDIGALQKVTAVRAELVIRNNDALTSFHGLENLGVAGNVLIAGNDALESLDGLSGLTELFRTFPDGNLVIDANLVLHRLRGMTALRRITGALTITNNPTLPTCEAEWLRDHVGTDNIGLGESVLIQGNDSAAVCPP